MSWGNAGWAQTAGPQSDARDLQRRRNAQREVHGGITDHATNRRRSFPDQPLHALTKRGDSVLVHGVDEGDEVADVGSRLARAQAVVGELKVEVREAGGGRGVEAGVDDGDGEAVAAEEGGELEEWGEMALEG